MKIRKAKIADAQTICALIGNHAERDRMLFRSMANIYENLQTFFVAEDQDKIIGCCALQVIWSDLAEIKSLAVDDSSQGKGIGKALVQAAVDDAASMGVATIFALTLAEGFFVRQGFKVIPKEDLPMKVWSDCAYCPKQQNCDEIAIIKRL